MSTGAAATRDKNKAKKTMTREEIIDFIMSGKATSGCFGSLIEGCKRYKSCEWWGTGPASKSWLYTPSLSSCARCSVETLNLEWNAGLMDPRAALCFRWLPNCNYLTANCALLFWVCWEDRFRGYTYPKPMSDGSWRLTGFSLRSFQCKSVRCSYLRLWWETQPPSAAVAKLRGLTYLEDDRDPAILLSPMWRGIQRAGFLLAYLGLQDRKAGYRKLTAKFWYVAAFEKMHRLTVYHRTHATGTVVRICLRLNLKIENLLSIDLRIRWLFLAFECLASLASWNLLWTSLLLHDYRSEYLTLHFLGG